MSKQDPESGPRLF